MLNLFKNKLKLIHENTHCVIKLVLREKINLTFRRATMNDLSEIQRIERASFPYPYSTYYQKLLIKNADIYYVAEYNGLIVGYIIARVEPNNLGHIISIAVHPDYRRKGIGETLMKKAEMDLKELGCYRVILEVNVTNYPAIKLYTKLGYIKIKVLHNYYSDGSDAYQMLKSLI